MPHRRHPAAVTALLLTVSAAAVDAGSLAASSAAGGSSASMGSSASSDSSEASSNSSSRRTAAAGPYRITAVAALADRPDELRLQLQAVADDAAVPALALVLPAALVARHGLVVGGVVTATPQPYGTALAHGRATFHLLLDDGWQRELDARPVQAAQS
ncbi:MAG TPA: hypothetical protein PKL46_11510 [Aquabacterium sp.]|nr:hypothetical protein [Aquabacterium sp.]